MQQVAALAAQQVPELLDLAFTGQMGHPVENYELSPWLVLFVVLPSLTNLSHLSEITLRLAAISLSMMQSLKAFPLENSAMSASDLKRTSW